MTFLQNFDSVKVLSFSEKLHTVRFHTLRFHAVRFHAVRFHVAPFGLAMTVAVSSIRPLFFLRGGVRGVGPLPSKLLFVGRASLDGDLLSIYSHQRHVLGIRSLRSQFSVENFRESSSIDLVRDTFVIPGPISRWRLSSLSNQRHVVHCSRSEPSPEVRRSALSLPLSRSIAGWLWQSDSGGLGIRRWLRMDSVDLFVRFPPQSGTFSFSAEPGPLADQPVRLSQDSIESALIFDRS